MERLKEELAKSQADAALATKQHQARAVRAATEALSQQEGQGALVQRLQTQLQISQAETAEALRQAALAGATPMDTSATGPVAAPPAAPDAAPAVDRKEAGLEMESLCEDLRAAREQLTIVTGQSDVLRTVITLMRAKQYTDKMRADHQLVLEQVTALQAEIEEARIKITDLEAALFAARVAAGLEDDAKEK